ncbi:MAG TPA: hypothetical protein VE993_17285, partial [Stellaceae bacterium]|nr:hypothetical protein [Stellaceae bacterium]
NYPLMNPHWRGKIELGCEWRGRALLKLLYGRRSADCRHVGACFSPARTGGTGGSQPEIAAICPV